MCPWQALHVSVLEGAVGGLSMIDRDSYESLSQELSLWSPQDEVISEQPEQSMTLQATPFHSLF